MSTKAYPRPLGRLCLCTVAFYGIQAEAQTIEFAPPAYPPNFSAFYGISVAGLDDVDGDGWGDIAIGDHGGQVIGNPYVGRVYIYSGRTHALLHTLLPPQPNYPSGGNFGQVICGMGDVNGDGRGDLTVGDSAGSAPGSPAFAGVVHAYSGADGARLYSVHSAHERSGLNFGHRFGIAPDIDGDGVADLVVGSESEAGLDGSPQSGAVYIVSGATGQMLRELRPPQPQCTYCRLGYAVAGVPDLDGDGRGDIAAVGVEPRMPGDPSHVNAYLYSGATGILLHTVPTRCTALSGVPDLDGDGMGDVLVGYSSGNLQGEFDSTGYVRVVSGGSGATVRLVLSPDYPSDANFGASVTGLGDADGDGRGDFLVGAINARLGNDNFRPGGAYLFSGATGSIRRQLFSLNPQEDGVFGISAASVPDINGDGQAEILVGAPQEYFDNGNSRGRAYIFLSCSADLNADGQATSQDFFDFLAAFFTAHPRADIDRDGAITSQDFFDYLAAFFAGCP